MIRFLKEKKGNYILGQWMLKASIVFLIFMVEFTGMLFHVNQLKRGTVTAMECALKDIYVNADNQVCIDEAKALQTLNTYLQLNIGLNPDLSPSSNAYLGDKVTITGISIYDPAKTGLPLTVEGKTFQYPTIHLTYTVKIKTMVASVLNLPLAIPYTVHIDESNEPPQ